MLQKHRAPLRSTSSTQNPLLHQYNMRNISALLCYHRANIHTIPIAAGCAWRARVHVIQSIKFSLLYGLYSSRIYIFRDKVNMYCICFYWVLNVLRIYTFIFTIYLHTNVYIHMRVWKWEMRYGTYGCVYCICDDCIV